MNPTHAHARNRWLWLPALIAAFAIAMMAPGIGAAKQKVHDAKALGAAHGKGSASGQGHHGHGSPHPGGGGIGKVATVMTRNVYLGADLTPATKAETADDLSKANGEILKEVVANDFPRRSEGLAAEILRVRPDLIGLQEVALWQTTPLSQAATPVFYDYLDLLLDALNAGKGRNGKGKPQYEVVVVQQEFDLNSPADFNGVEGDGPLPDFPNAELLGHLTMRDVILARKGAGVQTWNAQGDNFDTLLGLPVLNQTLPIARGWTATDAKVRGSGTFRFVNTHLEAFHPLIRQAQANELVDADGPATSSLPVVLVGDLNSDDDTVTPPDTFAYNDLLAAGMVNRSTDDPLSCCLKSSLLEVGKGGSVADFNHQVDHILTRDPETVTLVASGVTGLQPVDGFWSSDHAGVFSALRFGR